jgi:hypothetical protein
MGLITVSIGIFRAYLVKGELLFGLSLLPTAVWFVIAILKRRGIP